VPITASTGDSGFQPTVFPAVFGSVTAVGGTTLDRAANRRGFTEAAWSGAGSGCSAWIDKPRWQHDPNCAMRTNADVSAVANPDTGVAVYDTFDLGEFNGWLVGGGTSASAPIIAGVYALAGNTASANGASLPYANPGALFDVTSGSNGACSPAYLCTGEPGYDGPTGLGTPNGVAAF
jgi:subtilase family serine protease